ncbi:hypothetical protein GX408_10085 [bacterium]|nr:hypothetical protein [bacterium]
MKILSNTCWTLVVLSIAMGGTSCSVKPHSRSADVGRNKAVIDLQSSNSGKTDELSSNRRTRIAAAAKKSSRKKTSVVKNTSAAPPAVKTETEARVAVAGPNAGVSESEGQTETVMRETRVRKAEPAAATTEVVRLSERMGPERSSEYLLGFGDVIEVKFFNTPEYNETIAVRPDGYISLQQLGDIYVAGKSTTELDEEITRGYSEVLQNPDITILVRQFGGQQCYVMGEVERPGLITMAKGMTLMRAIAAAGGPKKTAKMSSVILIRSEDLKKAEATRRDLSFGHLSKHMEADLAVNPYDVIYVPKTFVANVGAFMSQIYDIVIPPFDAWARYEFWYKN